MHYDSAFPVRNDRPSRVTFLCRAILALPLEFISRNEVIFIFKGFGLVRLIERDEQESLSTLPYKPLPPVTLRIRQSEQRRDLDSSIGFVRNGTHAACTSRLQLPIVSVT